MNKIRNKSILQRSVALAVTATVTWTFALFPAAAEAAEAHRLDKAHRPVRTTAQILAAAKKQEALRESRMPHFPYVKAAVEAAKHPIRVASDPSLSILDEVGKLGTHVSNNLLAQWRRESTDTTTPEAKLQAAKAHLHIGEWELSADHNPRMALKEFHLARSLSAQKSDVYGLASYDTAVAQFYSGAYADATDQFKTLVNIHTALPGYPRQDAAMWLRHAGVCAAYHRDNSLLGIPEPPKLDPFCGAASLAACLKTLHVPYSKADVLKVCRVDGEGSNAQDIIDAAGKLGLVANFVGANEKGLINLPKPVVAFVERDHFVAVTKADAKGVSYLCSDCGAWPGGQVDLTWQQWRALNASQFVSITRPGSAQQKRLAELIFPGQNLNIASAEKTLLPENGTDAGDTIVPSHPSARLASWTPGMQATSHASFNTAFELPLSTQHQVRPMMAPRIPAVQPDVILTQAPAAGTSCGATATALPCIVPICCPKASGGPGFSSGKGPGGGPIMTAAVAGSSSGDPVNLANGQEEYTPPVDISVYNPHGPAVNWSRIYSSLRPAGSAVNVHNYYQDNDFGVGWSQTYNVSVYDPTNGATGSGNQKYLVYPNGSRVWFTATAQPTLGHPVQCTVQAGVPILVEWDYDSTGGSLGHYVITFQDRTKWITSNIVTTSSIYSYPLAQITDRNGNSIYFNYSPPPSGMPWPLLSSISTGSAGTGTVLLNIVRTGDGTGNICLINDCYGRSIYYHVGLYANANVPVGYPQANPELDHVSQIVASCTPNPADRYAYGYQAISNLEGSELVSSFLHTITVPSPTASGTSTATINYDPTTDFVSSIVDANGNQKIFTSVSGNGITTYPSNFTKTLVKDSLGHTVYSNTIGYDTNMSQTSESDGLGRIVRSRVFSDPNDPYRPSQIRDGIASGTANQGGSLSVVATGNSSPAGASTWDILSPGGAIMATNATPGSPAWSVTYSASTNMLTLGVPSSAVSGSGYTVRYVGGFSATFSVNPSGSIDGITSLAWDQFGNQLSMTSPRGTVTTSTWSYTTFGLGELTQVQQGSKSPTKYFYNEPSGLISTVQSPVPGTTGSSSYVTSSYTYNLNGDLGQVTLPGNNATSTNITTLNYAATPLTSQPLTVVDNLGHSNTYTYDSQDNITSITDSIGNETDFGDTVKNNGYNIANQPTLRTYPSTNQVPGGHATAVFGYLYPGGPQLFAKVYNESGNLVREVDITYGKEGELVATSGSTEPVMYGYDGLYRKTSQTDGNAHATNYAYNTAGYLGTVSYPGAGGATTGSDTINCSTYDANGNLITHVDGNGTTTTFTYNDAERKLTNIHYSNIPAGVSGLYDVNITYDAYGRVSTANNGVTGTNFGYTSGTTYPGYDDNDKPLNVQTVYYASDGVTQLFSKAIGYSYYNDGSKYQMSTPSGTFTYAYDGAGRATSLVNPFGETSSWSYYNNNWLQMQTLGNGVATTYTYNARGFLTDLNNATSAAVTLSDFSDPSYDVLGSSLQSAVNFGTTAPTSYSGTVNYTYDYAQTASATYNRDLLTQETSTGRNGGYTNNFGYDGNTSVGAGNATTFRTTGTNTYNLDNQITSFVGPTGTSLGTFAYDGNGNPTTYKSVLSTYDPANRLTAFGSSFGAGYTPSGLRAWVNGGGSTAKTFFLYDRNTLISELDQSGNILATNTVASHGLLSRRIGTTSTFYTFDEHGNSVQRLNSTQGVVGSCMYDAFGTRVSTDGSSDPYSGFGAQWGYYFDASNNMYWLTHRYYDPAVGRFINRDPIGYEGGIDLYAYVHDNPIGSVDPSGYCGPVCALLALIVIAGMTTGCGKMNGSDGGGYAGQQDIGPPSRSETDGCPGGCGTGHPEHHEDGTGKPPPEEGGPAYD